MTSMDEAEALLDRWKDRAGQRHQHFVVDLRAMMHERRGEWRAAELLREQLATRDPESTSVWILLAACVSHQGRLDEALEYYRRSTRAQGDLDEAWLNVGLTCRALARLDEAADAAEKVFALHAGDEGAHALARDIAQAREIREHESWPCQ